MSELVGDLKILRRLWLDPAAWGTTPEWEQVTARLFPKCEYHEKMHWANELADALGWSVA